MPKHLLKEIETLKRNILFLCAVVEEAVCKAVRAIEENDERLAASVIEGDSEIDRMEVELEEECLKVLALHQPVAIDLRLIVALLKINSDLERIGDLSVNIAKEALALSPGKRMEFPGRLSEMAERTRTMVKRSLDALVNLDANLAADVRTADKEVDAMNKELYDHLTAQVREQPARIHSLFRLISVARHLERIGDHATNIAEDIIYMLDGEIVRHRKAKKEPPAEES